jgi:hypothetical protein
MAFEVWRVVELRPPGPDGNRTLDAYIAGELSREAAEEIARRLNQDQQMRVRQNRAPETVPLGTISYEVRERS